MAMKKTLLLCIPLALAGITAMDANAADGGYGDYHYHDVLKPHGRARSEAVLQADAVKCERLTGYGDTLADLPRMERDPRYRQCLAAHGWKFYAYTPPARTVARAAPRRHHGYTAPYYPDNSDVQNSMDMQRSIDDLNATNAADASAAAAAAQAASDAQTFSNF